MTCPVNVSLSGAIRTAAPGAGAKNPPSLRRSEVYPLVFRQYYRPPYARLLPVSGVLRSDPAIVRSVRPRSDNGRRGRRTDALWITAVVWPAIDHSAGRRRSRIATRPGSAPPPDGSAHGWPRGSARTASHCRPAASVSPRLAARSSPTRPPAGPGTPPSAPRPRTTRRRPPRPARCSGRGRA